MKHADSSSQISSTWTVSSNFRFLKVVLLTASPQTFFVTFQSIHLVSAAWADLVTLTAYGEQKLLQHKRFIQSFHDRYSNKFKMEEQMLSFPNMRLTYYTQDYCL